MRYTSISPTLEVTAGAYTNGDVVGGRVALPAPFIDASGFKLHQVVMRDQAAQIADLRLHFYNVLPDAISDNAAFARDDDELLKWIGAVDVTTFVALAANSHAIVSGLDLWLPAQLGTIWMYIQVNDASPPTFAATDDLSIVLTVSDGG